MSLDATSPSAHRRDIVLVVDDSPDTLSFLTDALEEAGITVLVAVDGMAALDLVTRITPDLILLDAVMPGIDGFETCRRLKRSEGAAHVPVIFMTGLSETDHIVHGLDAGGVDYLTKPIVVEELRARMRVHLANARLAHSARLALDTAGRFLLACDPTARILWATPQAGRILSLAFPDFEAQSQGYPLPAPVARMLAEPGSQSVKVDSGGRSLEFSMLGRVGPEEILLRLTETEAGAEEAFLKSHLNLTGREAEVLRWIAAGKSNQDIGDILGISPRTVNKHLEQVYAKLGVENRASAAALAVRAMGTRA